MNRNKFIKIIALVVIVASVLPQLSFSTFNEQFTRNQLIGKGNPDLVGDTYKGTMHKETAIALEKLKKAASEKGIKIEVVSAYRSFDRQKQIFEGKYTRYINQGLSPDEAVEKIIEYSTIPGTSRHHWGTDLDLIDANVPQPKNVLQPENFHGNGPYCKFKEFMDKYANDFGFYEVYTDNANREGFKYEPWHFSYAPVSIPMLEAYKKLDVKKILQEEKVLGNENFSEEFIEKYRNENILDINTKLFK